MDDVQQATAYFWVPLVLAYGSALAGWMALVRVRPNVWPAPKELRSNRQWLDLLLTFVALGLLVLISLMHGKGYLLPNAAGWLGVAAWNVNMLLIFSPLLAVPLLRGQSYETLYLSSERLLTKVGVGLVLGVLAVGVFYVVRGEPGRIVEWGRRAVDPGTFSKYFMAVFLEGVALAFVLVRLRWALGLRPALLIPAVLFAAGHVLGALQDGRSAAFIATFFLLNTALVSVILYVVQRSRDVIWLGMVHYLMDIAIKAF